MRKRFGLIAATIIITGSLLGGLLGHKVNAREPLEDSTEKALRTFSEVISTIQQNYAQEVTSEELVESAIRGMLRTLDPHSSFFSKKDYNRLREEQQGKYFGLGITIRPEVPGSGRVVVVEPPAPGTPAYKAGLRAGDVIARIEGQPTDDWDVNEDVIPRLKGPKGTKVNISVERPREPGLLEFTVERDEIPLRTIKYAFRIRPGVGYVRIDRFGERTSRELDEALEEVGEFELEGVILDLRDNPGGALSQAIEVSDRFLEKGQVVVSTRNRAGKDREYTAPKGEHSEYPMVVLINQNSASASEIVSGALQDHDRALIVGQTSFGKALVQTIFPLEDNRGLALTTGRYYTPSDRLIQRDYSGSFWEYYNNRAAVESSEREKYTTDGGRVVFGGGGITPDVVIEQERPSKLVRRIQREGLPREFASRLVSRDVVSDTRYDYQRDEIERLSAEQKEQRIDQITVSPKTLGLFKEEIRKAEVSFSEDEFEQSARMISVLLRQEILLLLFGEEESYRVALELDNQVQTAIERLPQAMTLLESRAVARN